MREHFRELEGLFDWLNSFNRPEKGCDALIEWLELEQRTAFARGGLVIAQIGAGLAGFVVGNLAAAAALTAVWNVFHLRYTAASFAVDLSVMLLAGIVTGLFGYMLVRRRLRPVSSHARNPEALRLIAHLRNFTGYRGLRRELGEDGVLELDEGAQLYLRCRTILSQPVWSDIDSTSPWHEVRGDLLRAMDGAMDRLTVLVVKKRSFAEIAPALEEMRAAANEVQRITEKRSLSPHGGRDLRATLSRMRELAEAEDELLRTETRA